MRNIQWFINVCIAVVGKVNNSKCIFQIYLREAGKLIVYLPAIIHGENAPESPPSGTTEGYKRGLKIGILTIEPENYRKFKKLCEYSVDSVQGFTV